MHVRTNIYSGQSAPFDLAEAQQVRLLPDFQTALELAQTARQVVNNSLTDPASLKLLMGWVQPADR
jgi:hypothetical protein